MKKIKGWAVAILAILLAVTAVWWFSSQTGNDPFNESGLYVCAEDGLLYWFDLSARKGKVEGTFHKHQIIEEIGEVPFIEEKTYSLSGTAEENNYEFTAVSDDETRNFHVEFSGNDLSVLEHGEDESLLFKGISNNELNEYLSNLDKELEKAIDGMEEKEKEFIRTFFSDLRSIFGFLYTAENGEYQLFIKIDEALLEGELSGSLLVREKTENEQKPFEETVYDINGITDGQMLNLYTNVNGEQKKLEGNIEDINSGFYLTFWESDEKLLFEAVSEEEYENKSEEFKLATKQQN